MSNGGCVTLDEVFAAAGARRASIVPETSGYLALAIGDAIARLPFALEDRAVMLTTEGTVSVTRRGEVVTPRHAARGLRDVLARLLAVSAGTMRGLAGAARPREESDRGVEQVVEEIEAALIPVNRAAARRALARLARETLKAKESGKLKVRAPQKAASEPAPAIEPEKRQIAATESEVAKVVEAPKAPVVEAMTAPVVEAPKAPVVEAPKAVVEAPSMIDEPPPITFELAHGAPMCSAEEHEPIVTFDLDYDAAIAPPAHEPIEAAPVAAQTAQPGPVEIARIVEIGDGAPPVDMVDAAPPVDMVDAAPREPVDVVDATPREPVEMFDAAPSEPVDMFDAATRKPADVVDAAPREPVDMIDAAPREPFETVDSAPPAPVAVVEIVAAAPPEEASFDERSEEDPWLDVPAANPEPTPTVLGMAPIEIDGPPPIEAEHKTAIDPAVARVREDLPPQLEAIRRATTARLVAPPLTPPFPLAAPATRADDLVARFGASCGDDGVREAAACLKKLAGIEPTPPPVVADPRPAPPPPAPPPPPLRAASEPAIWETSPPPPRAARRRSSGSFGLTLAALFGGVVAGGGALVRFHPEVIAAVNARLSPPPTSEAAPAIPARPASPASPAAAPPPAKAAPAETAPAEPKPASVETSASPPPEPARIERPGSTRAERGSGGRSR